MTVRYHLNPDTGRPNICRAQTPEACKYYDKETQTEPPHFETKADAYKYYEKTSSDTFKLEPLQKGDQPQNFSSIKEITGVEYDEVIDVDPFNKMKLSPINRESFLNESERFYERRVIEILQKYDLDLTTDGVIIGRADNDSWEKHNKKITREIKGINMEEYWKVLIDFYKGFK